MELRTSLPAFCALEITSKCNHACPFCSNPWADGASDYPMDPDHLEMPGDKWVRIINRLSILGVREICLTGGEPSLHPDFKQIVSHLCVRARETARTHSKLPFSILTNGDSDVFTRDFFYRIAPWISGFAVSLLGDKAFYTSQVGGNYDRKISTIELAVETGMNPILNLTIYPHNMDSILQTVRSGMDMGVKRFLIMRPIPIGRCKNNLDLIPGIQEFKTVLAKVRKLCEQGGGQPFPGGFNAPVWFPP